MSYERLNLKTGQVITEEVFAHLEDGIEGAANAVLMTPILYADLVALRDAGKLKAGMFYRITDYVTTTVQANTQSAGHAFDVIVMATDSKTLSEEARAIVHEGDTYFTEAGANLAAWKVWYALDNDSARFAWAAPTDGILREITLTKYGYTGVAQRNPSSDYELNNTTYYAWTLTGGPGGTIWFDTKIPSPSSIGYDNAGNESSDAYSVILKEVSKGKGVIYRMVDEGNNSCPYDFKNIMFTHPHDTVTYPLFYYTFSLISGGGNVVTDDSLVTLMCHNNVMGEYFKQGKMSLNSIVLISGGQSAYNNSFGNNCYSNSFGDGCHSNSFGDNCYSNSFDRNCFSNSFGNDCNSNSFGNGCYSNSFGNGCYSNSFKNTDDEVVAYARNIAFGNGCSSVILQNDETASSSHLIQNIRVAIGSTGTIAVNRHLTARDWVVGLDESRTLTIKALI